MNKPGQFTKNDPRINRLGRGGGKQGFASLLKKYGDVEHAKGQTKMEFIAEKVISLAASGEEWAVKALMDRIDGRPRQVIEIANEDEELGALSDGDLDEYEQEMSRN